jgi:type II secretory pathway component PulM
MKFINLNRLNRLNRREKYYVAAAAAMVGIFLVFQLIIFPISDKRELLERTLAQRTDELKEMRGLQSEYLALEETAQRAKSQLARRDKNFTLFSYLGNLADTVGIKANVSSMKSSSDVVADVNMATVKLEIDNITTEQFAKYLHQIEYSGYNLFVKRMVITKKTKPEGYIDVSLQVETVES